MPPITATKFVVVLVLRALEFAATKPRSVADSESTASSPRGSRHWPVAAAHWPPPPASPSPSPARPAADSRPRSSATAATAPGTPLRHACRRDRRPRTGCTSRSNISSDSTNLRTPLADRRRAAPARHGATHHRRAARRRRPRRPSPPHRRVCAKGSSLPVALATTRCAGFTGALASPAWRRAGAPGQDRLTSSSATACAMTV